MESLFERVFQTGRNQGFIEGLLWVAKNQIQAAALAESILKDGEYVACRNAVVIVDEAGNVSWMNSNFPPMVWSNVEE
jgi:hypothetical protein